MKRDFKRRKYPVIFRDRQYRMLLLILLYSFSIASILFVFLFLPDFYLMKDEGANQFLRGQAANRVLHLHTRLWPAILMVIGFIGLHSFRLFSVTMGPLKRLGWAFDSLKAGDLTTRLALRKGDFLTEEADSLNAAVESLSAAVLEARAAAQKTRTAVEGLRAEIDALPPDPGSHLAARLQALERCVDAELRCFDYFKISESKADSAETSGPADDLS